MEVASAIVKARRALAGANIAASSVGSISPSASPQTDSISKAGTSGFPDWLAGFLSARKLEEPNGNPLYRYRMTDEEYEKGKAFLDKVAKAGLLENGNQRTAAVFVACCSEWFRRHAQTTERKWKSLAPDVLRSVPESSHDLTKRGLQFWRRPLERSTRGREFLLTLALEGGFPVQVLRGDAKGWLKDYLRALIRRGLTEGLESAVQLREVAEEENWLVRKSYRNEDFIALCGELAMGLIQLRRSADAQGLGGIANTIILEKIHPKWRDELPIYVPAEDRELADALLKGLIDEKIGVLSAEGLETRRFLIKRGDQWSPAVQVLVDGEIPVAGLPQLSIESRARAIPAGELGNFWGGEIALFEPPADKRGKWRVRPLSRVPRLIQNFSFSAPVVVTLTSPTSAPHQIGWPKGEPLRSDILVFHEDEASKVDEPILRYWRSGSVSSQAKNLYVLFPQEWIAYPGTDTELIEVARIPAMSRRLAKLRGVAYFGTGEPMAPRYRIATGEEQKDRELQLKVVEAGFELLDERCELVQTGTFPTIKEGIAKPRTPTQGEIYIRRSNGWQELRGPLTGQGTLELSWRDPTANIQLDKRQLLLLPVGAHISGRMKSAIAGEVALEGLEGWSISACLPDCETRPISSGVSFSFTARPVYRLPLMLKAPTGASVKIIVPLQGRDAVLALADGTIVQPRAHLDLGQLRGGIISTPRMQTVELSCREARWASARLCVDGEVPLGSLTEAVRDMFAVLPNQDDELELSFIGDTRPPVRISRYRRQQLAVDSGQLVRWIGQEGPSVKPVAKMILDPRHEHALELERLPFWQLPERCKGPCVVYLRDDTDVLSRPVPVGRPGRPPEFCGPLMSALIIPDPEIRKRQVLEALSSLAHCDGNADDFNWLSSAATHLNGLPPNAFDALKLLPQVPVTLVRLLLRASADQRPTIWALQSTLPFLWLSLPITAWGAALRVEFETLEQLLRPVFGPEKTIAAVLSQLQTLRDELQVFEPALEAIFATTPLLAPKTPLVPLNDLVSAYVRAQHERDTEGINEIAIVLGQVGVAIPQEVLSKSHAHFAGLFAPIILAAGARGKLTPTTDLVLVARRTMREEPQYVSQVYRHLLRFYA